MGTTFTPPPYKNLNVKSQYVTYEQLIRLFSEFSGFSYNQSNIINDSRKWLEFNNGTIWATTPIGVNAVSNFYFQWGDFIGHKLEEKFPFSLESYRFYDSSKVYPHCYLNELTFSLNTTIDPAEIYCGPGWRTPTRDELMSLLVDVGVKNYTTDACNIYSSSNTSADRPYIHIPFGGRMISYSNDTPYQNNEMAYLWTSQTALACNAAESDSHKICAWGIGSDRITLKPYFLDRWEGCFILPIYKGELPVTTQN